MTQQTLDTMCGSPPPLSTVHGRLVWSKQQTRKQGTTAPISPIREKAARLGTSDLSSASNNSMSWDSDSGALGPGLTCEKAGQTTHLGYHTMQDKGWAQNQTQQWITVKGPWWWRHWALRCWGPSRHRKRGVNFTLKPLRQLPRGVVGNTLEDPVHGRRVQGEVGWKLHAPGAPAGSWTVSPWIYRRPNKYSEKEGSLEQTKNMGAYLQASEWRERNCLASQVFLN